MIYGDKKNKQRKSLLLWGILFMTIGILLDASLFVFSDNIWDASNPNYLSINSSLPQVINISYGYVNNSLICTPNNHLCLLGNGNVTGSGSVVLNNSPILQKPTILVNFTLSNSTGSLFCIKMNGSNNGLAVSSGAC